MTARGRAAADGARRSPLVLVLCCISLFVTWLDNSIVNVALPTVQESLHASVAGLQWVVDAYLVVLASLLLAAGSLSDRVGRRRVFLNGLALFAVASLACSLAPNLATLIVFRMLQAAGGSLLVPSSLSILTNTYTEPADRARALGVWSAIFGLAIASGPVVGGFLVDGIGWRSIFWVNVPIGVITILAGRAVLPESRAEHARRVDRTGQLLASVAIAAATYGAIEGPAAGWLSGTTIGVFVLAAVALALFVSVELHVDEPLLELRFFGSVPFSAAFFIAATSFFIVNGFLFLNTFLLQIVEGHSALSAGLRTLPATLAIAPAAVLGGRVVARRGPRVPLIASCASMVLACVGLAFLEPSSPYGWYVPCYLCLGAAIGIGSPACTNTALSGMPRAQAGVASGGISLARQLGNVFGVAVLGSVLASRFRDSLEGRPILRGRAGSLPLDSASFSPTVGHTYRGATTAAFHVASEQAWLVAGAVTVLGLLAAFACAVPAPEDPLGGSVSRHRGPSPVR